MAESELCPFLLQRTLERVQLQSAICRRTYQQATCWDARDRHPRPCHIAEMVRAPTCRAQPRCSARLPPGPYLIVPLPPLRPQPLRLDVKVRTPARPAVLPRAPARNAGPHSPPCPRRGSSRSDQTASRAWTSTQPSHGATPAGPGPANRGLRARPPDPLACRHRRILACLYSGNVYIWNYVEQVSARRSRYPTSCRATAGRSGAD